MNRRAGPFARGTHAWGARLPALRAGAVAVALFSIGILVAQQFPALIASQHASHGPLGMVVFVVTSAVAVLLPMLTNLALVPLAVLAWGPQWTASLLLLGWIIGAVLSFTLGRHAQRWILERFPSVRRHADIDRLIAPRHRMLSLILLRMSFPVDVLSYALGLFSRSTTAMENAVSTLIGAAPFAWLFAYVPALPWPWQLAVFAGCTLLFVLHLWWTLARD